MKIMGSDTQALFNILKPGDVVKLYYRKTYGTGLMITNEILFRNLGPCPYATKNLKSECKMCKKVELREQGSVTSRWCLGPTLHSVEVIKSGNSIINKVTEI